MAHRKVIAKLCDPIYVRNEMGILLETYFNQSVLQCTRVDMEATVYQWPSFSVFEDRGTLGELLEDTLESIFSFADAFHTHTAAVMNTATIQPQSIKPTAIACNLAFENFNKALKDSAWNHSGREDAANRKKRRDCLLGIQTLSACKAIADLCEGLSCGKSVEEAESLVKEEIFIIETSMYACWYSTPMYHWMRTLIQLAASSKLDLTKYYNNIMKIVAKHREPIIKYYNKFTQLLGKDVLEMVDPALNSPQNSPMIISAPTSNTIDHLEYMAVYWYMYLLQLVEFACNSCRRPWEIAERFANVHHEFHQSSYSEVLKSSMVIGQKMVTTAHAQVENLRLQAIGICPKSSAESILLSQLLPDIL